MKARLGKEIALLCLPMLGICGVGWFISRQQALTAPPEDLSIGKPRVVIGKWRKVDPTPFDVYRGYTQRFEVESWVGGLFPPLKASGRAGTTRITREAQAGLSDVRLYYRLTGKKWHKVKSIAADSEVEVLGSGPRKLNDRLTHTVLVRTTALPDKRGAVILYGTLNADVVDREDVTAGVFIDSIVNRFSLRSKPLQRPLQVIRSTPVVSQACPLKLKSVQTSAKPSVILPRNPTPADYRTNFSTKLIVDLNRSWFDQRAVFASYAYNNRLFDATGKLVKLDVGQGSRSDNKENCEFDVRFDFSHRDWKSWKRPFTLQTALTVDNCWPLEVSIQLSEDGLVKPPVKSNLPFRK